MGQWGFALLLAMALTDPTAGAAPRLATSPAASAGLDAHSELQHLRVDPVAAAMADLVHTFGDRYPQGADFLNRWEELAAQRQQLLAATPAQAASEAACRQLLTAFEHLRREALLANPLLDFDRLLVVKRKLPAGPRTGNAPGGAPLSTKAMMALGLPSNHECNSSLSRTGYDNEIAVLSLRRPDRPLQTFHRPPAGGYVGELDLHWDADRLLFTQSDPRHWTIWEARADGAGLRQVSQMPDDVDCFDACYLPNGQIIFGSTASYQAVPCWHGQKWVSNLYRMNADGTGVRQVCFDQDHDFHPVVLPNGQVLYHRWDYTGINHIFLRQLMVMNPDGTGQRAVYGSSSWYPNSLYFPRPVPGDATRLATILSGYHGAHRMGQLVVADLDAGWHGADGLVTRISGRGQPIDPQIKDNLVDDDWPKFLHPFPLDEKYFLVAAWPDLKSHWGIYLADVFDNLIRLREEPGWALFEPVPLQVQPRPPVIPERVDPQREDAVVYLHDVHAGPGLEGVPRGTVRALRVLAYHFGYRGLAGPDKVGFGGPWEVMRILGTVPLEPDGSALFRVPANMPVAVQALDAGGQAVQWMRSWFTAMPGETLSCLGCHDRPREVPPAQLAAAARQTPRTIIPWHGPARGFDFAREVQPVLDRHCVGCHDGRPNNRLDLRAEALVANYAGRRISKLGVDRLHPAMKQATGGTLKYTPAYEALLPFIRRVSIEDDVSMLVPGEFHADTSELIQRLRKGHHGVRLDAEDWDRLVTWIDLNAPCHGTWGEVYPIPEGAGERRLALRRHFGGPKEDPEIVPAVVTKTVPPVQPGPLPAVAPLVLEDWPVTVERARARQAALSEREPTIDLGEGVTLKLVRLPAGRFVMGEAEGEPDEHPLAVVAIARPFWMAACEISNEQFRRYDSSFDCQYYGKRHARPDDQGLPLNGPTQPAVRVSWNDAMAFCRWLSQRTGRTFTLPTEAQWEYACRAGAATPWHFGDDDDDFSAWANLGDRSFGENQTGQYPQTTGGLQHLVLEGAALSDRRFDDRFVVTAPVGSFQPNAWGLHDLHGNAAEWTRTTYQSYPYRENDGRNDPTVTGRKVVRGGSFFDRPERARSAHRLAFPTWQRVFNVGFRVVCLEDDRRPLTAAIQ